MTLVRCSMICAESMLRAELRLDRFELDSPDCAELRAAWCFVFKITGRASHTSDEAQASGPEWPP